jgi:hypothetical protein
MQIGLAETAHHLDLVRNQAAHVFRRFPDLPDHRKESSWVVGALGDPASPVWFIAENPSLGQVERAGRSAPLQDPELQWAVSEGDKLFRRMLVKHGFKTGGELTPGGWRCYITDVIKSAYRAEVWRKLTAAQRRRIAEQWAPVLAWEIEVGAPKLLVSLGGQTHKLIDHLANAGLLPPLPERLLIDHYSYIALRPEKARRLGPMNPVRIAEYDAQFAAIARRFRKA